MTTHESVDVLIVGSGPVGATYARCIAERAPAARILMVEVGPDIATPRGTHVRNIADPDDRARAQRLSEGPELTELSVTDKAALNAAVATIDPALARPGIFFAEPGNAATLRPGTLALSAMSSNVGGMGSHWSFACPRPGGAERIAWIPEREWDEALTAAERLLSVTTDVYLETRQGTGALSALAEEFGEDLPEGRHVQALPLACRVGPSGERHWTGTDVILEGVSDSPRFEVRSSTLCRRLIHDEASVTGALLECLASGERREIYANAVVVAGDSLRTPQLLWASGIRPPALGRYLNDHTLMLLPARLSERLVERVTAGLDLPDARAHQADGVAGVFWIPYSDDHPCHGVVWIGAGGSEQMVELEWLTAKEIRPDDRVVFSDETVDGYGMPGIRTEYVLTDRDHEVIAEAKVDMNRAARALAGDPSLGWQEPKVLPCGSSLHYQGTVRMGQSDDGSSVCDQWLRVWGFDNLFVGGNGVIPTSTACNPTLTSVALAARASEYVGRLIAS